jgi:hypothetical protein
MFIHAVSFSLCNRSILHSSISFSFSLLTISFILPFSYPCSFTLFVFALLYFSFFSLSENSITIKIALIVFQLIFIVLHPPMIESMDIAVLLVNTASTNLLFSTVTYMISSIINPLIENHYDIRLASIKLESENNSLEPVVHSFTRSVAKFKDWLGTDHAPVERYTQGESIPICK